MREVGVKNLEQIPEVPYVRSLISFELDHIPIEFKSNLMLIINTLAILDNLKSAFTIPIAGSHSWQKVSPMKVGRATHACLATKFGVSLKNFLLTNVVEGLGIIP